jgi:hypothetical protein
MGPGFFGVLAHVLALWFRFASIVRRRDLTIHQTVRQLRAVLDVCFESSSGARASRPHAGKMPALHSKQHSHFYATWVRCGHE